MQTQRGGLDAPVPFAAATMRRLTSSLRGMTVLLLAAVFMAVLLVCAPVLQCNIAAFIGANGTEASVTQWAMQLQWNVPRPPCSGAPTGTDFWAGSGWSMPWFCVDADPRGGALRGLSSTAVALAAFSIAAQRAENDAAGAEKAQQMAIPTAGLQLALLLDAIQPGTLLWPAYTPSTDVSPNFEHDQFEVVSGFVQIMGASKTPTSSQTTRTKLRLLLSTSKTASRSSGQSNGQDGTWIATPLGHMFTAKT